MNSQLIDEFHSLAEFLAGEGVIRSAEEYRENPSALVSFARRLKTYAVLAPRCRGKKVLDIGCSLGHGARILAEHARAVVALDSSARVLAEAFRVRPSEKIRCVRSTARRLPFPDRTFGAVAAFHLIEHLPPTEVVPFLRETRRVTESGGVIFITTPNRRFRLLPLQRPFNPDHRQEFTVHGLRRILSAVFDDCEITGIRASSPIENIERARVRLSPLRVYLRGPLAAVLAHIFPALHRWYQKATGKFRQRPEKSSAPDAVGFRGWEPSLNDYYLDGRHPERGIDLMAVCRKADSLGANHNMSLHSKRLCGKGGTIGSYRPRSARTERYSSLRRSPTTWWLKFSST